MAKRRRPKVRHAEAAADAAGRSKKRSKKSGRHKTKKKGVAAVGAVRKKRTSKRRKTSTASAGGPGRQARAIPVEGLAGAGLSGRYPGPAKPIEQYVTKVLRPSGNQDLAKTDVIHFQLKVREGQLVR